MLSWIEHGFPLVWKRAPDGSMPAPPAIHLRNHKGADIHANHLDADISALLAAGAIKECRPDELTVVSPLNVVPKPGSSKLRTILDLRHVNAYVDCPRFQYEELRSLRWLAQPNDWQFSLDLAAGYWQIDTHSDAWPYLGCSWRGRYFYFKVLPFGLTSAPWCFTKVMRVVVEEIRSRGVPVLPYIDDFWFGLSASLSEQSRIFVRDWVLSVFSSAGLTIQLSKSHLTPTRRLARHLGFVVDLALGRFEVAEERWSRLQATVTQVLDFEKQHDSLAPRLLLERVAGMVVSMSLALGPVSMLLTRATYAAITRAYRTGRRYAHITRAARDELLFWASTARTDFCCPLWPRPTKADVIINTDAGGQSWGAVCEANQAQGFFPPDVRQTSSTLRELLAVRYAIESFGQLLVNRVVRIRTDNMNVPRILSSGSRKPANQAEAISIFNLVRTLAINNLEAVWVPREENTEADAITRWHDSDDWQLDPNVFGQLDKLWGPHTCDRFGSHTNHLLQNFNSRFWCPGTSGVDAFAQADWAKHNNWCNGPFSKIGAVVAILRDQLAAATVIVPFWRSAPWWPALVQQGGQHFYRFVHGCTELRASPNLFRPGPSRGNQAGVGRPSWRVLALRIDMRRCVPHAAAVAVPR